MTPPRIQTWLSPSCPKLDAFVPFLGKYHRPVSGRCCQTCTPRSWDGFYPKDLAPLGFRDASRLTEADTRFRGWLVRRVCGFLAAWEWEIPAESPGKLLERICSSRRVQDAASSPEPGSRGDEGSQRCCREEIRQILGEIQAPLSPLLLRLCHWLLPKLLTRVFLSVQLHRGQLEMVLQAARTPKVPLVFLCSHQSPLDGPLLSFLLLSQGVGLPRVAVSTRTSPRLRSLLQRLGGIFLPSGMAPTWSDRDEGLPGAVLDAVGAEKSLWSARGGAGSPQHPQCLPSTCRRCCGAASPWCCSWRSRRRCCGWRSPPGAGCSACCGRCGTGPCPTRCWSRWESPTTWLRAGWSGLERPWGWARVSGRRSGPCAASTVAVPRWISLSRSPYGYASCGSIPCIHPALGDPSCGVGGLWAVWGHLESILGMSVLLLPALGIQGELLVLRAVSTHRLLHPHPQEFVDNNLVGPILTGSPPEQLLLPTILGRGPPDVRSVGNSGPALGTEEEILVMALGLHALSDSRACSAVTAVGITAALLLHRHQEVGGGFGFHSPALRAAFPVGITPPLQQHSQWESPLPCPQVVLLPRLMLDFSELLEQLLLRGRAVSFSGQLRVLLGHSLRLLQPLQPLQPPQASARARLGWLAGGVRHQLAGEAVGACAIRALLLEMLPILGPPSSLTRIMLSRDELLHKILELLQLLPPTLLGLQPCRPPDCHSLDILDKLILGGLLEEEEVGDPPQGLSWGSGAGWQPGEVALLSPQAEGERWGCDVAPRRLGQGQFLGFFTDDSDSDSEHGVPKQCYKTYGRAVEFLQRPPWPQPEQDCVEALLEFLAEEEDGHPDRSLALSSLQSFKDMGVLEELQTPTGPTLQLSQPFQSASNREKLAAFIQQFTQL
ncbi:glycerol-3-phosphate acyltransferase 2, mitochondrial isoform X5 [Agelaius phoeniceus]|uniref:glycerol-3-phosphate acyltransferase 2, mitochondrial isoform X5 n=1 Tax=Agelaius phoeniceus TaxID=39638 RepID=UPI004054FF2D